MIISEFLPDPAGKDTGGEWMELFNNGASPINLKGWAIKDASGKTFKFTKETPVEPGTYLKIDYLTSKISLNNNGETIFLYDLSGSLIDKAEYSGKALEGQPLIRQGDKFIFNNPKSANEETSNNALPSINNYSAEAAVLNSGGYFNFSAILAGVFIALILSVIFVIVLKNINVSDKLS